MIYVFLANGFEDMEAIVPIDCLRRAKLEVQTVGVGGKEITSSHGITVKTDITEDEVILDKYVDLIVLPGGMPGTLHMAQHSGLTDMIKSFNASGKRLAAICAAPMVFAGCGILSGKKAVIYPGMEEHLGDAEVSSSRVQTDGNIITSQGPGTAMEFALEIIRTVKGEAAADEIRKELLMI